MRNMAQFVMLALAAYPAAVFVAEKVFEKYGLVPVDVPTDGTCLSTSVCVSVGAAASCKQIARQRLVECTVDKWDETDILGLVMGENAALSMSEWLQSRGIDRTSISREDYYNIAIQPEFYLSECEIQAFASTYNINIFVHNATEGSEAIDMRDLYEVYPMELRGVPNDAWSTIHLLYVGNHYMGLQRLCADGGLQHQDMPVELRGLFGLNETTVTEDADIVMSSAQEEVVDAMATEDAATLPSGERDVMMGEATVEADGVRGDASGVQNNWEIAEAEQIAAAAMTVRAYVDKRRAAAERRRNEATVVGIRHNTTIDTTNQRNMYAVLANESQREHDEGQEAAVDNVGTPPVPNLHVHNKKTQAIVRGVLAESSARVCKVKVKATMQRLIADFSIVGVVVPAIRHRLHEHVTSLEQVIERIGVKEICEKYAFVLHPTSALSRKRSRASIEATRGQATEPNDSAQTNEDSNADTNADAHIDTHEFAVRMRQAAAGYRAHQMILLMHANTQCMPEPALFPRDVVSKVMEMCTNVCESNRTRSVECGVGVLEEDRLLCVPQQQLWDLCLAGPVHSMVVDCFSAALEGVVNQVANGCLVHIFKCRFLSDVKPVGDTLDFSHAQKEFARAERIYGAECVLDIPILIWPVCMQGQWSLQVWNKSTNCIEVYDSLNPVGQQYDASIAEILRACMQDWIRSRGSRIDPSYEIEARDTQISVVPAGIAPQQIDESMSGVLMMYCMYYRAQWEGVHSRHVSVSTARIFMTCAVYNMQMPLLVSSYQKLKTYRSPLRWKPALFREIYMSGEATEHDTRPRYTPLPKTASATKDGLTQDSLVQVIKHVLQDNEAGWTKAYVVRAAMTLVATHELEEEVYCDWSMLSTEAKNTLVQLVERVGCDVILSMHYTPCVHERHRSPRLTLAQRNELDAIEAEVLGDVEDEVLSLREKSRRVFERMDDPGITLTRIRVHFQRRAKDNKTQSRAANSQHECRFDENDEHNDGDSDGDDIAELQDAIDDSDGDGEEVEIDTHEQEIVTLAEASSKFEVLKLQMPIHECSCCGQLFFINSMTSLPEDRVTRLEDSIVDTFKRIKGAYQFCVTCASNLRQNKIPTLSRANGMCFPEKPECIERLTELESRLVAPRQAFAQFRKLTRGGQMGLKGSVVNIPANTDIVQTVLPRLPTLDQTVGVCVKRKLEFAHAYCSSTVRPRALDEALDFLLEQPLYKKEGIRKCSMPEELLAAIQDGERQLQEDIASIEEAANEEWGEEPHRRNPPLPQLTMIHNYNSARMLHDHSIMDDQTDPSSPYNIAPSEGMRPLGLFQDRNSEELNFPNIFCGQSRDDYSVKKVRVSYKQICKWELRAADRRAATCVSNIFFKLRLSQIHQVRSSAWLRVRKSKLDNRTITAGQLRSSQNRDQLLKADVGYHDLATLRTSPDYYDQLKKTVFAMIRQLGIPTWFFTFSAADLHWYELIVALSKTVDDKEISIDEAKELSYDEKNRLLASDPVTCSRFYRHRMDAFRKEMLEKCPDAMGGLVDFFLRDEFQKRGSPHSHGLGWVKDAPIYGLDPDHTVVAFIDKYVSAQKHMLPEDKIFLQEHRHSKYCQKVRGCACRFGFPKPPMRMTHILKPFMENELSTEEEERHQQNWDRINTYLSEIHPDDIDAHAYGFVDFLEKISMTEPDYILAIRSSIERPTVFHKRNVVDIRINAFGINVFSHWGANMDMQFVLDPYAAAMYVVSYMMKGQRGLSTIMQKTIEGCNERNASVLERIRQTGNAFMNAQEICAQEACYVLLGLPLKQSSRSTVFVNTNRRANRAFVLKSDAQLANLEEDSTEIAATSLVDRYMERPDWLHDICLADFACKYDRCKSDMGYRLRSNPKILRSVRFNKLKESEEHYRELYMLYYPWDNEEEMEDPVLVGVQTHQARYELYAEEIMSKKKEYEQIINWDDIQQQVRDDAENVQPWSYDGTPQDDGEPFHPYDTGADLGRTREYRRTEDTRLIDMMPNGDYFALMRLLNDGQRAFHNHVMHWLQTRTDQLFAFLSGGAGVGKTLTIKALQQSLLRLFRSELNASFDKQSILTVAFTGKAAFGVEGNTVHSALTIKCGGFEYRPLSCSDWNSKHVEFEKLKSVIIDEVSLIGTGMFGLINKRLQEIMRSTKPFGGLHVIVVGDLFQLPPVGDAWIFNNPSIGLAALHPNLFSMHFRMYELTQVMRQDNIDFVNVLNRVREGLHTEADIALLRTKETTNIPDDITHLFASNKEVNTHNEKVFTNNSNDPIIIKARDSPVVPMGPAAWDRIREAIAKKQADNGIVC